MVWEFEIDLNLTAVFNLYKSPICSPDLISIEHIWEYKYFWKLKEFRYGEFKTKLKFIKFDKLKFILIMNS